MKALSQADTRQRFISAGADLTTRRGLLAAQSWAHKALTFLAEEVDDTLATLPVSYQEGVLNLRGHFLWIPEGQALCHKCGAQSSMQSLCVRLQNAGSLTMAHG
jgi:hypothetical protein